MNNVYRGMREDKITEETSIKIEKHVKITIKMEKFEVTSNTVGLSI